MAQKFLPGQSNGGNIIWDIIRINVTLHLRSKAVLGTLYFTRKKIKLIKGNYTQISEVSQISTRINIRENYTQLYFNKASENQ